MAGYTNYQFNPQQQNGVNNMMPTMGVMNTAATAPYNPQFVFPQPVGSVYNLNTAADIGNVPTGANVSVGLCLNENILYVKTLQNGVPSLLGYRLSPIEGQGVSQPAETSKGSENLTQLYERIERIEKMLFKPTEPKPIEQNGGKLEWQV